MFEVRSSFDAALAEYRRGSSDRDLLYLLDLVSAWMSAVERPD